MAASSRRHIEVRASARRARPIRFDGPRRSRASLNLNVRLKEEMRIAILGNSGSGKSTLAQWLAERAGAALLDLDTVAWEPGQIGVSRLDHLASADVQSFCSAQGSWIVEGCYANLMRVALHFDPRFVFLNPGKERCIANCRARPWEPHKYSSKEQQDERLSFLLSSVGAQA